MQKHTYICPRLRYAGLFAIVFAIVFIYLASIINTLTALMYQQKFVSSFIQRPIQDLTHAQYENAVTFIRKAINQDHNNAEYYFALENFLYQYYLDKHESEMNPEKDKNYQNLRSYLGTAVSLDPGSPWYYYELGRLELQRSFVSSHEEQQEHWGDSPAGKYFSLALQNAPNNVFLYYAIGWWLYTYNPEQAFALIQGLLNRGPDQTLHILNGLWPQIQDYTVLRRFLPENKEVSLQFSQFLYDKALDYESDLEALRAGVLTQTCPPDPIISRSHDNREIELGRDDGSPEWRTFMGAPHVRVQKMICLPEDLEDYHSATLKIYMSNGGKPDFMTKISINRHLIASFAQSDFAEERWYEFPFDQTILEGKSRAYIYLRVLNASTKANRLHVYGDQGTPTNCSIFNFLETQDLSYDRNVQTGEYLIRVVLKK